MITFRYAIRDDLAAIVALLADDPLGATREQMGDTVDDAYVRAFEEIDADDNNQLIVVVDHDDGAASVVGVLQLTIIPGLSRMAAKRAQIESVRIAGSARGRGLGRDLFAWALDEARARGCRLAQLTSDKQRGDAHRFYESLGFQATHEGYKMRL